MWALSSKLCTLCTFRELACLAWEIIWRCFSLCAVGFTVTLGAVTPWGVCPVAVGVVYWMLHSEGGKAAKGKKDSLGLHFYIYTAIFFLVHDDMSFLMNNYSLVRCEFVNFVQVVTQHDLFLPRYLYIIIFHIKRPYRRVFIYLSV